MVSSSKHSQFGHVDRRAFVLDGLAALSLASLGTSCLCCSGPAHAQTKPHRIDVHHHISPPTYVAEITQRKLISPPTRDWTPTRSIDEMDKAGVATAISSITAPGIAFADQALGRKLARECNEYAAKLAQDHPGRFGIFAMLPLTDIDGSLTELAYSLDVLKADGVAVFTSYGDKWLGDPAFTLVLEELDRRGAIVYTHPRTAACCVNLIPHIPDTVIEYGTDTARAIASLVFSGAAHKYTNTKFIFSHAGGTMPFLLERFTRLPLIEKNLQLMVPDGALAEVQRFYYDIAWSAHPPALAALTQAVPMTQIVFGSDYPFRTCTDHVKGLAAFGLSEKDLLAIERENALRLMPRYA